MRKRTSRIWTISKEELQEKIDSSSSLKEVLRKLGYNPRSSGSFRYLKERIREDDINLEKLEQKRQDNKKTQMKKLKNKNTVPLDQILVENSLFSRYHLKNRLISEQILKYKCSECGLSEWNGKEISLQLDHINGIHDDNRLENLRLLCPNCHSQTETFCGKQKIGSKQYFYCEDCGDQCGEKSKYCKKCYNKHITPKKKFEISKEDLQQLVWEEKLPYVKIAERFGVSDNAIRKRCKVLGIEVRRTKKI